MHAPKNLDTQGKAFWRSIVEEIEVCEPHDLKLLETAGMALDRVYEAQDRIKKDGPYQEIPGGGYRAHPGLKVQKEFLTLFYRCIKDLKLDPEPMKIEPLRRTKGH